LNPSYCFFDLDGETEFIVKSSAATCMQLYVILS